jgi:hypothetical protein
MKYANFNSDDFSNRISTKEIKYSNRGNNQDDSNGKKPKDKKKDYSQERKQKRGE